MRDVRLKGIGWQACGIRALGAGFRDVSGLGFRVCGFRAVGVGFRA